MKILLTGQPGIGKTTLILNLLSQCRLRAGGFYTKELRQGGTRTGFEIHSLDGSRGVLAHRNNKSRSRVGCYGVDINAMEGVGVRSVEEAIHSSELIVVDEIGKMELLSPGFADVVARAIESGKQFLATVMKGPHPFADMIKKMGDTRLIEVTYENRCRLVREIASLLAANNKKSAIRRTNRPSCVRPFRCRRGSGRP
jgi:nucleoside-triphosphatase